jgi:hypothetical protein
MWFLQQIGVDLEIRIDIIQTSFSDSLKLYKKVFNVFARLVELVDTLDSKSGFFGSDSSSLSLGTMLKTLFFKYNSGLAEWLKAHDWNSCKGQPFEDSNSSPTAIF